MAAGLIRAKFSRASADSVASGRKLLRDAEAVGLDPPAPLEDVKICWCPDLCTLFGLDGCDGGMHCLCD